MDYLPVFLHLKERPCLVVGGGDVAARKVRLLLDAGAQVTVLAPTLCEELQKLKDAQRIVHRAREFHEDAVDRVSLLISATDRKDINRRAADCARAKNIPVNVVDDPALCSFIFPSILDRSPVVAAISSGGRSPVLARLLRARLESLIPADYGRLAALAESARGKVKQAIADPAKRRRFWEKVLQGKVAEMVFAGRDDEARRELDAALEAATQAKRAAGEVYLVGAGPGDPDLLTFRALRLMQQADVVVYDRLVSQDVLNLVRKDAEKIYAGKERDNHSMPQEAINDLLARLALSGKRVVRLKGGDPFIFGRGGEEIETLMEQGIHFQVVPGITAASGCASYAGIPLTHRDHAHSCLFVTGHRRNGTLDLDWEQLSHSGQTVVIYMGLVGLESICRGLIDHGRDPDTPAALVQQGTTRGQRVITGTVADLPGKVAAAEIKAPTLIIIGSVVTLHRTLAWFHPEK